MAKPKVPPLSARCHYELQKREGPPLQGEGIPVHVNLDSQSVFGCCVSQRKLAAIGFDTTGDGFVDSLDTNGDGFLDTNLSVVAPSEHEIPAARDEDIGSKARQIFDTIDSDGSGSISKFDLVGAMQRHRNVDDFVLPDSSGAKAFSDESGRALESVEAIFAAISGGTARISKDAFVTYFEKQADGKNGEAHKLFSAIDLDHSGTLSKYEVLAAVQRLPAMRSLIMPDRNGKATLSDDLWNKVDDFFESAAGGKQRISFDDFATFYHIRMAPTVGHNKLDRSSKNVLIIGPGFGRELNPAQSAAVMRSGFRTRFVLDIPNPETPGFKMEDHIGKLVNAVKQFQPDLVMCASKGWPYVVALWQNPVMISRFATVMINVHPSITRLPKSMNIVIAHGSNDETYKRTRESLENLTSTADFNRCFLYWTANSGRINGGYSRYGDKHDMASLLTFDCLPRLMDAALSTGSPENEIVFSWRDRLGSQRREAEQQLSGDPTQWAKKWNTKNQNILQEVNANSEEFNAVFRLFHSTATEPANYQPGNNLWTQTHITKIERVQNLPLMQGLQTYFKKLGSLFRQEGIEFVPNVHTRWVFHGTDAVEAIVSDPLTGFQPLASSSRLGSLWGPGTYFARDAKYVVESGFCTPGKDGARKMLLCLVAIGVPCLGDPEHKGILPYRNGQPPYKYNSTVDSLSSPEIFIIQEPSAAYPAYAITLR